VAQRHPGKHKTSKEDMSRASGVCMPARLVGSYLHLPDGKVEVFLWKMFGDVQIAQVV